MHHAGFALAAVILIVVVAGPVWADTVLFSDGFEDYTAGGSPLDKNYASGPNAAPNGTGNPWFGPAPPNARVVGAENGVMPHGGNQMIRGSAPADFDENWVNIAYRCNGGSAIAGDLQLDWWFYDPLGAGASAFKDYAALGFYNTAPSDTDYPGSGSLNSSTTIQRLSLGATSSQGTGFDANLYQARVVAATDGYGGSSWFNTNTTRSVGWHHGRIVVGAALEDSSNDVSFYIDDMTNPTFTHNSVLTTGYNVIELNTNYGATSTYYDDVTLSAIPEPATLILLSLGGLSVIRRRK